MKKLLSFILILTMLLSVGLVMASCGLDKGDEDAQTETKISMSNFEKRLGYLYAQGKLDDLEICDKSECELGNTSKEIYAESESGEEFFAFEFATESDAKTFYSENKDRDPEYTFKREGKIVYGYTDKAFYTEITNAKKPSADSCAHRDANDDGKCDMCGTSYEDGTDQPGQSCSHRDADDNYYCDNCGVPYSDGTDQPGQSCSHRDANDDYYCDKCGVPYSDGTDQPGQSCNHRDADDNYYCDNCGMPYEDGADLPSHEHATEQIYTVKNDENYPFDLADGLLTSTNHDDNSASYFVITAEKDFTLLLEYRTSSEGNCDHLYIYRNDATIVDLSGVYYDFTPYEIALSAGDTVTICYSKDGGVNNGDDCAYVRLLTATTLVGKTDVIEPTCTEDGSCYEIVYCICGEELWGQTVTLPALDHADELNYTTANDENYPFDLADGLLTSTNHDNNSASYFVITAERDFTLLLEYMTSSEGCDYLRIYLNEELLMETGGVHDDFSQYEITLSKGDAVTICYSKDGSVNTENDCAYVRLLTNETEKRTEIINRIEPTCTEEGSYEEITRCGRCDTELSRQTVTLPMLEHDFELNYTTENDADYPFTVIDNLIISTNHTHDSSSTFTITAKRDFTLEIEYLVSSEGSWDYLRVYHNENRIIETSGTDYTDLRYCSFELSEGDTVRITYSKDGGTDRGDDLALVYINTLPFANAEIENVVEPTCAAKGSYDCVYHCVDCGIEGRTTYEVEPTGEHSVTDGYCTVCGGQESSAGLYFSLNADGKGYTLTGYDSYSMPSDIHIGIYNGLNVTGIAGSAFYNTNLTSVTFGEGLKHIGGYAFYNCYNLTEIVLPDSLSSIGAYAFYDCYNLSTVKLGEGLNSIGSCAFYECRALGEIVIPNSVTFLDENVFQKCTNLERVTIGTGIDRIPFAAFSECEKLTSVIIPANVKYIGDYAFCGCTALESVVIEDGTEEILDYAFDGCYALREIVIPDSVTSVDEYAFSYCTALERVVLGDGLNYVSQYTFYDCENLTDVVIGAEIDEIYSDAFTGCTSLANVYHMGGQEIYVNDYNEPYLAATHYYYSESAPETDGNFWYYGENGEILIW